MMRLNLVVAFRVLRIDISVLVRICLYTTPFITHRNRHCAQVPPKLHSHIQHVCAVSEESTVWILCSHTEGQCKLLGLRPNVFKLESDITDRELFLVIATGSLFGVLRVVCSR